MAIDVDAKCIVVSSLTGRTVRMVSRFRCPVDIIGMTTSEKAWRKLNPELGCKAGSVRGIQLNGGYVLQCDE